MIKWSRKVKNSKNLTKSKRSLEIWEKYDSWIRIKIKVEVERAREIRSKKETAWKGKRRSNKFRYKLWFQRLKVWQKEISWQVLSIEIREQKIKKSWEGIRLKITTHLTINLTGKITR